MSAIDPRITATARALAPEAGDLHERMVHCTEMASARRVDIAGHLEMKPSGGHWNAGWKELRDNGIVTVEGDIARLTELFRPGG